ncbi:ferrous iron transport protein B [Carboxylicivirga mesophila]|uniref:Ferrous iron transport protein B n=1 Tax=Carboxylicivirga mesophila TaxID=1166478 RepID=A0ABS5KFB2_9BACT|nr:ferrous iron transport protein B [Carboxylicivirga mesophila]MBS2213750.1 ferrous iron transport protein B [Carboxylicivirga mesophila]
MNLSELSNGNEGVIVKVKGHGAFRKRITEMGFIKGKKVTVVKNAPLKDPIEYQILDYKVSLRRSEAKLIEVVTVEEAKNIADLSYQGTISEDILKQSANKKHRNINIVLVGNPNCGKTTLFNYASGAKEHVGNYSGVTVDAKAATFLHNGYQFNIIDLPGTYSISAYSPEETFVREYITNENPDIVVNVLDSSNLERNLYLTTQLIDLDIKVVVALNMFDEMQRRGDRLNYDQLGAMLGIPFVPTVSSRGKGVTELFDKLIDVYEDRDEIVRHIHVNYGDPIESAIEVLDGMFIKAGDIANRISPRYLAIKALEKDKQLFDYMQSNSHIYSDILKETEHLTEKIEKQSQEDSETIFTDARYGFVAGALKETFKENPQTRRRRTDSIDALITHRLFGFPIFIFFMWLMFQSTFKLGEYPMTWIETGVAFLSDFVSSVMPDGSLKHLLVDGVIGGVGGVIVFLPNILILFFFISFMEDTGYMARAAFIMDKLMHKMGLHGKSFIPLVMGFGCNVPAVMATRTIENRNNRLLTMLINPFMSCSARLPVYILIIGAIFPENAGTMLFIIYGVGILLAVLIARLFKRFIFKHDEVPFVMELPPYRIPTLKNTIRHMWHKGAEYLKKMGGIILVASIIIWFLSYYPQNVDYSEDFDTKIEQLNTEYASLIAKSSDELAQQYEEELTTKTDSIELIKKGEHQSNTYIGRLGKSIEPVIQPLGFDWKMGVSLITGIAAKEIVISTMAVIYHSDEDTEDSKQLITQIREETHPDGRPVFNKVTAFGFMVFILIYFPCVAVVAAIRKESGSWKWALFTIFYTTGLAWVLAFAVNQVGHLLL